MTGKKTIRVMNIRITAGFIFALLCLSSLPAYGQEVKVEIELNDTEFTILDPVIMTVRIKNVGDKYVALDESAILRRDDYSLTRQYFSWKRDKNLLYANFPILKEGTFFILPPGKYVTRIIDASSRRFHCYYKGYETHSDENWSVQIILKHYVSNDLLQEYKEFAEKNDAVILEGEIKSNNFQFKYLSRRNNFDIEFQNLWTNVCRSHEYDFPKDFLGLFGKGIYEKYPEAPILDYWFWYRNRFYSNWSPWKYSNNFLVHNSAVSNSLLEEFISKTDDLIYKYGENGQFSALIEELLWNKAIALKALGREMEAEALKEKLISEEPDRVYDFELKLYESRATKLKKLLTDMKESEVSQRSAKNKPDNKIDETEKPEKDNLTQPENNLRDTHKTIKTKPNAETNPASGMKNIDEQSGKSKSSTPLILISVLVLGIIAGVLILVVICSRRSRAS